MRSGSFPVDRNRARRVFTLTSIRTVSCEISLDNAVADHIPYLPIDDSTFRSLTDAMPQMVWSTRPDGYHDYYNAKWYDFTGVPPGSTDGEGWAGMFHPDDQPSAWERWRQSLETGDPYEVEYRLRHRSGLYRWTIGRAHPIRNDSGDIVRWIGTCTDIHDAKVVAEQNEILSRELSHRIKNIFAVVSGLIALSARQFPEAGTFADRLRQRVGALGRANEYARPHSERSKPELGETTLNGLVTRLAEPYPAYDDGRIRIMGGAIAIDDRGATPVSLVIHELLTNALKYGALTSEEGTVDIEMTVENGIVKLRWRESDGPEIAAPPTHRGFGTLLADLSVERQMGGTIRRRWNTTGLEVDLDVEATRLARS
ncbi:MAG: sensor histidine kinase [Mesorhizobium sp.]